MLVIDIILLVISLALAVFGVITITNAFTMLRLGKGVDGGVQPVLRADSRVPTTPAVLISILVPMRNEKNVISRTLRSLLAQDDPAFEVLVLDDESDDGSADATRRAAEDDPRFKLLTGQPLPLGWKGKNWACAQLARSARGEYLVFTDADVHWVPYALSRLRRALKTTQADAYTIWPTQVTESWGERLVVPMIALAAMGYLPAFIAHNLPWAFLAASTGQCRVFRRSVYQAVGGHAEVKDQPLEDDALMRQVKLKGYKLRRVDGAGLISCRMYSDWPSVRDGFAKNILVGHGGIFFMLLSTLFHWLVFVFPWAWFLLGWVGGENFRYPIWALTLAATGLAIRALTAKMTRQRVGDAFLLPASVVAMTLIAGHALRWHWSGGTQWKGRILKV